MRHGGLRCPSAASLGRHGEMFLQSTLEVFWGLPHGGGFACTLGQSLRVKRGRLSIVISRSERSTLIMAGTGAIAAEVAAEVGGSLDVAVRGIELHAGELLQMGRLGVDEELVDRRDFDVAN